MSAEESAPGPNRSRRRVILWGLWSVLCFVAGNIAQQIHGTLNDADYVQVQSAIELLLKQN